MSRQRTVDVWRVEDSARACSKETFDVGYGSGLALGFLLAAGLWVSSLPARLVLLLAAIGWAVFAICANRRARASFLRLLTLLDGDEPT